MEQILGLYNYWIVIFLMMTGFYIVIARENMVKTVIGLNIFQTSVFLLYITMGKVHDGTAPILKPGEGHGHDHHHESAKPVHEHAGESAANVIQPVGYEEDVASAASHAAEQTLYSNPLPSVLMLTAIVVGIATTALALALIVRIREDYGTIEENEILELDRNS